MDFERLCMAFTLREPFYGILLSSINKECTLTQTETLGVGRSGNTFKLYYNPNFLNKLTDEQALEILKHEMLHLAFSHFTLFENEPPEVDHEMKNIAADMEVNGYLKYDILAPIGGCSPRDFGWDWRLGGKEYLRRLRQTLQQQKEQAKNPQHPCNGGQGGKAVIVKQSDGQQQQNQNQSQGGNNSLQNQSQQQQQNNNPQGSSDDSNGGNEVPKDNYDNTPHSFDDHNQWPIGTETENEQLQQMVEDILVFAAEEVEKHQGSIPGELVGKITELRKKKVRPVADWKRFFRRYLGNEFTEMIRKSKKRESRRFPDAAGNRHRRKSHILVAIDTSGSVSMPEYREFFGQIRTLTKTADFHVVECDTVIQHEYDYRGRPNETLHGGGGTRFEPPIEIYNQNKRKYDALVYFTDGEARIPKDTPKDCLWVISSKGDQSDRKKYQVNGASVVFIPKHD